MDFATYDESLLSKLTTQLDAQQLSEIDNEIVLTLIDHLDSKGFVEDYKGVRESIKQNYNVDDRRVFQCLKVLQSFEPDGLVPEVSMNVYGFKLKIMGLMIRMTLTI